MWKWQCAGNDTSEKRHEIIQCHSQNTEKCCFLTAREKKNPVSIRTKQSDNLSKLQTSVQKLTAVNKRVKTHTDSRPSKALVTLNYRLVQAGSEQFVKQREMCALTVDGEGGAGLRLPHHVLRLTGVSTGVSWSQSLQFESVVIPDIVSEKTMIHKQIYIYAIKWGHPDTFHGLFLIKRTLRVYWHVIGLI